jgi:Ca-activated chloride channel family protein
MKKYLVMIAFLLAAVVLTGCSQSPEKLNNKGNEAFAEQDYEDALLAYSGAQENAPEMAEPYYNAANAHYRLQDYEQAQQQIEQALVGEEHLENLEQNSYYNLGNTFYQAQQFEAAIEVYKEALRLNPDDLEAKQNLELALRQLQEQEQQQQQQQQEQQEQQDNQDQQDEQQQNEQQQNQQQNEEQQDQQDQSQEQDGQQNEQQQDPQDQNQQQDEQQSEEQQDQQQNGEPNEEQQEGQANGQPNPVEGLTEEQAKQLLEAAAEGTESLEEALQQIMAFPPSQNTEDW